MSLSQVTRLVGRAVKEKDFGSKEVYPEVSGRGKSLMIKEGVQQLLN